MSHIHSCLHLCTSHVVCVKTSSLIPVSRCSKGMLGFQTHSSSRFLSSIPRAALFPMEGPALVHILGSRIMWADYCVLPALVGEVSLMRMIHILFIGSRLTVWMFCNLLYFLCFLLCHLLCEHWGVTAVLETHPNVTFFQKTGYAN